MMSSSKNNDLNDDIQLFNTTIEIELGMEFNSDDEAYTYYNNYARRVGFSIRREYVNKNKIHGYVTSRKFTCYKEGHREDDKRDNLVKKHRKETRTGCLAHIIVARQPNEKYYITSFEKDHNHPLAPPSVAHMLPSQRKLMDVQAHELDLADDSGIRPKLALEYAARQAGGRGNLGFTDVDLKNHLRDKRQNSLRHGEAQSLLDYFETRRFEDPTFYFSTLLDEDGLVSNVFWVDGKMIMDYRIFGDVVSFDTTFRTNKHYRPFGIFVGMNNHRNTIVFGACLLYDETIESFSWLFERFLKVMSMQKPKTILTDQDQAMSKALSLVMPETYHRLCVWHLQQNALKHLAHVFTKHKDFTGDFSKLMFYYETEDEFCEAWNNMINIYDLGENEWLKTTYSLRHKWSMTYGRNTFSAGMRSTQLSESFNGSLRGYLNSDLNIVQFFNHFERAVNDKRYNESKSLFDMTQRIPILKVDFPLLRHARDVYTSIIFEMFQEQWMKSLLVVIKSLDVNGSYSVYKVGTFEGKQEHTVLTNSSERTVYCSCNLFEYLGILCRHSLKILDVMNIKNEIPTHYILKRWTKDATIANAIDINEGNNVDDPALEATKRYRKLCQIFTQMSITASESEEAYELALDYANKLNNTLNITTKKNMGKSQPTIGMTHQNLKSNHDGDDMTERDLITAKGLKTRVPTRRSNSRPKSFIEKATKKKKSLSNKKTPFSITDSLMRDCESSLNGTLNGTCNDFEQSQLLPPSGFLQLLMDSDKGFEYDGNI